MRLVKLLAALALGFVAFTRSSCTSDHVGEFLMWPLFGFSCLLYVLFLALRSEQRLHEPGRGFSEIDHQHYWQADDAPGSNSDNRGD